MYFTQFQKNKPVCKTEPVNLVEEHFIHISMCKCCKRIGLHYTNLLCSFRILGFKSFASSIIRTNFNYNAVYFPDQTNRIIISTCHQDIQFCFTEPEFYDFQHAMNEALLMLEVHIAIQEP
ncbi:hypothetical protein AWW68_10335 [Roseivirga spongicola]|uniref:Uncharacterized protein n=1 Tax=Roseivirga spongicola TaxID=333140 RepID=A0A150X934_9BACT|nr:hypothetical protein AWW68_10335 [Roseivirga spongicola]